MDLYLRKNIMKYTALIMLVVLSLVHAEELTTELVRHMAYKNFKNTPIIIEAAKKIIEKEPSMPKWSIIMDILSKSGYYFKDGYFGRFGDRHIVDHSDHISVVQRAAYCVLYQTPVDLTKAYEKICEFIMNTSEMNFSWRFIRGVLLESGYYIKDGAIRRYGDMDILVIIAPPKEKRERVMLDGKIHHVLVDPRAVGAKEITPMAEETKITEPKPVETKAIEAKQVTPSVVPPIVPVVPPIVPVVPPIAPNVVPSVVVEQNKVPTSGNTPFVLDHPKEIKDKAQKSMTVKELMGSIVLVFTWIGIIISIIIAVVTVIMNFVTVLYVMSGIFSLSCIGYTGVWTLENLNSPASSMITHVGLSMGLAIVSSLICVACFSELKKKN